MQRLNQGLNLALWTCDVGATASTPHEFAEHLIERTIASWDEGADLVAFPEYAWMGLERFVQGDDKLAGVAELFWNDIWPAAVQRLSRSNKAVVLGTAPFAMADGSFRNRAPIIVDGKLLHQDKLHLTPWETAFSGGDEILVWEFRGCRCVVVICLDVEIPELFAALRGQGVDVMLVPSATESILGVERVGRCADARAVELGCYVGLCHLVGTCESVLVDENTGRLGVFTPSQMAWRDQVRQQAGEVLSNGFHCFSTSLDLAALTKARRMKQETNPVHVAARKLPVSVRKADS